jgi:hypothetical protein
MRAFFFKILVFIAVLVLIYSLSLNKLLKGYVDQYYNKFTWQPKNLVLGLSRAHNAINPRTLEIEGSSIGMKDYSTLNFAFNKVQSSFGELYIEAVKKKLKNKTEKNNAIHIVCVSPASLSAPKNIQDDNLFKLDQKSIFGKLKTYNKNPNYNYVTTCLEKPLYSIFLKEKHFKNQITHTNGWNEVKIEYRGNIITQKNSDYWRGLVLREYKRIEKKERKSKYRIHNLVKLINYLKNSGEVYVVRIPAHKDIIEHENQTWHDFSKQIDSLSIKNNVLFLDYSNKFNQFKYYDGTHMESNSAKKFSAMLMKDIIKSKRNKK